MKLAIWIMVFLCWFELFSINVKTDHLVAYDCRLATYPTAIDVPQEVIKKCREKASDK